MSVCAGVRVCAGDHALCHSAQHLLGLLHPALHEKEARRLRDAGSEEEHEEGGGDGHDEDGAPAEQGHDQPGGGDDEHVAEPEEGEHEREERAAVVDAQELGEEGDVGDDVAAVCWGGCA